MQEMLLRCGYALPKYGSDGDFGAESEAALKSFQEDNALTIDGVYSARTHAALLAASREDDDETREDEAPQPVGTLEITGARVYGRAHAMIPSQWYRAGRGWLYWERAAAGIA